MAIHCFIGDEECRNWWHSDDSVCHTSVLMSRVLMKTRSVEDYEILRKVEPGYLAEIGCEK